MTFKNIVTSFVLALAVGVPSVSSAMTNEEAKDSLATIIQLVNRAQSMLDEMELSGVAARPLTALTNTSYDAKDANRDGKINYADLVYINDAIATDSSTYPGADINGDGKVSNADFLTLREHFKNTGDYIGAYDMPTIGAGWTLVPADEKIDQNDVNAVNFAKALYEKDNAYYAYFADLNYDGKVDAKDVSVVENYIENGPTKEVSLTVEPVKTAISPNRVEAGERAQVTITGNLDGLHSLVLNGAKARTYIIMDFEGDSSKITLNIPAEVVIGDYDVQLLFGSGPVPAVSAGTITVVDSTPDAPKVTLSLPQSDLPAGTTNATLAVKTDIASKCSFSQNPDTTYANMTPFQYNGLGTDKNISFHPISGLTKNTPYNYFVMCKSSEGVVMDKAYLIDFSVENVAQHLNLEDSSSDPDGTTIVLDENKNVEAMIFAFDLDMDDSDGYIDLEDIAIDVTVVTGENLDSLVEDFRVEIDGNSFDAESFPGTGLTETINFDMDGEIYLKEGERVTVYLYADFKELDLANEGSTIFASISPDDIDAEGDETGQSVTIGGTTKTGDTHTLRSKGIITEMTDGSATVTIGGGSGDDYATFEIEVEATAFEHDVYISTDYKSSMQFSIVDGAGKVVTGTSAAVLSSSADDDNNFFNISEGETETLTLTVTFDPATAGVAARLQLNSITFDENGTVSKSDDQVHATLPTSDYQTKTVTISN